MGWLKRQFQITRQGFIDIKNFKLFKKEIKEQEDIPNSTWHRFDLHHNKISNIIYTTINIPDDYERSADDRQKWLYIKDLIKPINQYLSIDLNWGEYLDFKCYHYENADDPNDIIYTYQIEWKFVPFAFNTFAWWRNMIFNVLLVAAAIVLPIVLI